LGAQQTFPDTGSFSPAATAGPILAILAVSFFFFLSYFFLSFSPFSSFSAAMAHET
jgi:hypothetical protein